MEDFKICIIIKVVDMVFGSHPFSIPPVQEDYIVWCRDVIFLAWDNNHGD